MMSLVCIHRGGERDLFPVYAAEGRRQGLARLYSHPLSSGPYGPQYESKVSLNHVSKLLVRV